MVNQGNRGGKAKGNILQYILISFFVIDIIKTDQKSIFATKCEHGNVRMVASQCTKYNQLKYDKTTNIHLLEKVVKPVIPAVKCIIRRSTSTWYCGRYSHLHLAAPQTVNQPILLTPNECIDAFLTKGLDVEGVRIPIKIGQMKFYNVLINGSITYPKDILSGIDPACTGQGINVDNIFVPSSFIDLQIATQLEIINLQQLEHGCYVGSHRVGTYCTKDSLKLDSDRIIISNLTSDDHKYVSLMRTIDIVNISLFTNNGVHNNEQGSQLQILFNPQRSLALELKTRHRFEVLLTDLEYVETNVHNIFVWFTTSNKPFFPYIHVKEKSDNTPLEMVFSFVKFQKLFLLHNQCLNEQTAVQDNIKIYRNRLVRSMGELDLEIPCHQITVNITLGENLPCYFNHLTIKLNDTLFGISPFARLIKETDQLLPISCQENPVFLKTDHNMFVGNKGNGMVVIKVTEKDFNINQIHSVYTHVEEGQIELVFENETMEEAYLSSLALDAKSFKVKVQEGWFLSFYNKTISWLSSTWKNIIMFVGTGIACVGSLVCITFVIYILACTQIHATRHESAENVEMMEH